MPRIDPLQLLKCLGVLLTPAGGIRSNEEVQRLASLMMKFSKKLVSKCVYILILKNTEPHLLGLFMSAGGWTLVLTWLSDGISGKNWALVSELLELLLMCPVDVERLKSNSIPRLVKGLSKDETLGQVNILASRLVEQWLKIVKDETVSPEVTSTVVIVNQDNIVVEEIPQDNITPGLVEDITLNVNQPIEDELTASSQVVVSPQQFYKVTVRDGKQVIAKVDSVVSDSAIIDRTEQSSDNMTLSEDNVAVNHVEVHTEVTEEKEKKDVEKKSSKEKEKDRDKEREKSRHDRSKHRSSSSSSKSSSKSSSSKDKHSNSNSSSSRDKNKDKDRDRTKDRDKHKHRSNGSVKQSSSSSNSSSNKDNKEKQAEKDKDTLAKIQPKSVDKLGRIPKKSSSSSSSDNKKSDKKSSDSSSSEHRTKPSISIEVRKKDSGDRPKTVKVFNSKLRSTGLEEAPKPPPPRSTPKKPTTLPSIPVKRPSPSREAPPPPEKRIKLPDTDIEKPGGIKLIPPKPKPAFLQESNMFMDALASSATNKKEPKKRKRRTSVSKDTPTTPTTTSPPASPSVATPSPLNSPLALKNIAAPKFYKETLDTTEETKPVEEETSEQTKPKETEESTNNEIKSPDQVEEEEGPTENVVKEVDGVRGVLVYHKRKGPKKSVKWRQESELEEIQYFELDETERVNVTKTFMDMKQMEHVGEREALQLSRKLPNEDLMDERIPWKILIPIDLPAALAEPGKKSLEKDIQFAREKVILQALYFNRSMLPDSAAEPDPETHQMTDPVIIPLDDVTGNPDSINDFQGTPWPEPKGSPPHPGPMPGSGPPNLFAAIPPFTPPIGGPPAGGGGGGPGFSSIPPQNFNGPNFIHPPHLMGAGDWRPMGDGNMPPESNHSGPINPLFNQRPDTFNDNPPVGFPPQGFGPPGPMGPPGPGPGPGGPMYPNFPNNRGGNRGGFRNMGRGGWFRPAGPPPGWHGNRGGGGGNHWGGRVGGGGICKQFKMHGYCRQRDTCPFMHPQSNGPY